MMQTIGIFISAFLAFILFSKKNKSAADLILGFWLTIIACHLGVYSSIESDYYQYFPYLLGVDKALPFIHGPLLYLYTLTLTNHNHVKAKVFIHFLLPIIAFVYVFIVLPWDPEQRLMVYQNNGLGYEKHSLIILIGTFISGAFYILWTIFLLKKYKSSLEDNFSSTDAINLDWLWRLAIGLSLLWVLVIFTYDVLIFTGVTVYVIYIGYYGIKQGGIFSNFNIDASSRSIFEDMTDQGTKRPKYENSGMTQETAKQGLQKLRSIMETDKPYLNPTLSLSVLANLVELHPNYLSQIINEIEMSNFYDYVNKMRIEEFKQKVIQPESKNFTIIALAFECGFNSKATFNRLFKKYEGCSPSDYIKQTAK